MPFHDHDHDEELMTQFFSYAALPLYKYALKLLGNPTYAEDAVQATFMQLLQYFDNIRTFSNERFLGYARKVLLHQCATIARQQEKFPVSEDLGKNEPDPAEPVVDFVERRATREEIRICIEKLSPRYRFILYLKYFENRSCDEIGSIMGLKESNVRTLLTRARTQLKLIYMRDILRGSSECIATRVE